MARLGLVFAVATIILVLASTVATAEDYDLTTYKDTLRLVRGTAGEEIGPITYRGSVEGPSDWDYCKVTASARGVNGLTAEVASARCDKYGRHASITITVNIGGAYGGGDASWTPLSAVRVAFYANGSVIDTVYPSVEPIEVREVSVSLELADPPIDTSQVRYRMVPEKPALGSSIYIYPAGPLYTVLTLSDNVDVPTTLTIEYRQSGGNTSRREVYVSSFSRSYAVTLRDVDYRYTLTYSVKNEDVVVASGSFNVSTLAGEYSAGGAMFMISKPYLIWQKKQYRVVSHVYVTAISGTLSVVMTVDGANDGPAHVTITAPGTYDLVVSIGADKTNVSGSLSFTFSGHADTVLYSTSFNLARETIPSGATIQSIFTTLFIVMSGAGFASIVAGIVLRRPDLQTNGVITLASSVLIFIVPTIMGYIVVALVQGGLEDPVGLQDLTMMNLGDKIDRALSYTQELGVSYANRLIFTSLGIVGIIGLLGAATAGGGVLGIFTGGALSQFLGRVLGDLGGQLISMSVMGFIGGWILKALAIVYPILVKAVLLVLLAVAVYQALFGSMTGTSHVAFNTIINIALVVLLVLVVPVVLAAIDRTSYEQKITVKIKGFSIDIPNVFAQLPLTLLQVLMLATVLVISFHRLVTVLGGGR